MQDLQKQLQAAQQQITEQKSRSFDLIDAKEKVIEQQQKALSEAQRFIMEVGKFLGVTDENGVKYGDIIDALKELKPDEAVEAEVVED